MNFGYSHGVKRIIATLVLGGFAGTLNTACAPFSDQGTGDSASRSGANFAPVKQASIESFGPEDSNYIVPLKLFCGTDGNYWDFGNSLLNVRKVEVLVRDVVSDTTICNFTQPIEDFITSRRINLTKCAGAIRSAIQSSNPITYYYVRDPDASAKSHLDPKGLYARGPLGFKGERLSVEGNDGAVALYYNDPTKCDAQGVSFTKTEWFYQKLFVAFVNAGTWR